MKKAIKFTYYLALWIVGLFTLAMFMTYFSEWIQSTGFFGDTLCRKDCQGPDAEHTWGNRHCWYFWMCILLFLLSLVRIIVWGAWYWHEEEPKEQERARRY